MSQILIQQYRNQLQDLRKVSGTHRESVVREAFKDLLKGWARSHDLVFVPEYEIETKTKDRRYVDGALLYELRMPFGYWEAKDEKDDLDAEIETKFRRGYLRLTAAAKLRDTLCGVVEFPILNMRISSIGLSRHVLLHPGRIGGVAVIGALLLNSCGGGGGVGSTTPPSPVTPPARLVSTASTFTGGCGGVPDSGTLYTNDEVEPYVAINPANPNNLIGTWQQDRWSNGGSQGIAVGFSMDGGATWTTRALPVSRCGGGNATNGGDYERASDPWVTISPDGTAYQLSLALSGTIFTILQPGSRSAMLVSRSADGGRSWGATTTLIQDRELAFNDKGSITADPTDLQSQYVYAVWDRLTTDNRGPAMFARTSDGGATWEAARPIYDPGANNQTLGNVIAVLPDGTLIDFFTQINAGNNAFFAVIRSTDKGASWSAPVRVADFLGIGTLDPDTGAAIRDSGFLGQISVGPQPRGQLFVVWQDARFSSGARDGIAFARSDDGGLTWSSPPVRVNADPAVQALVPSVNARADGTIGVSYYDMRSNTADGATLPVDYWLARSRDGIIWNESRIAAPFDLDIAPVDRCL